MTTRFAALVKQVPRFETMTLGADGRLQRDGVELEMNPYCRRAVAQAVALRDAERAAGRDAEAVVFTMGPPSAEDCLREAIACGADRGVLLSDRALAGSDTLATAQALDALLRHDEAAAGAFALVLVGKNSVDADTGQVGPELAELRGAPFAGPVRSLDCDPSESTFVAECETDAGTRRVRGPLPAVLSCAERLIAPAKADVVRRGEVDAGLLTHVTTTELGAGPWGDAASPTKVGGTRTVAMQRSARVLDDDAGPLAQRVALVVDELDARGVLGDAAARPGPLTVDDPATAAPPPDDVAGRAVWAVVDPTQPNMALELGAEAVRCAARTGGDAVIVLLGGELARVPQGVAEVVRLDAPDGTADEDHAATLTELVCDATPFAVLLPSTARGREIASRVAAACGWGLTGDVVEVDCDFGPDGTGALTAWKPAFGGQLVAAVWSTSPVQLVTVRPGVLDVGDVTAVAADTVAWRDVPVAATGRVTVDDETVEDDLEVLATATAVIGVGAGVDPSEYGALEELRVLLDAEIGATRKVTDKGWLPRSRQIGITGRAVAPALFVSIGSSGKFNHSVGLRAARCVVAVNPDPGAPIFRYADLGIVGDWHDVVPLLTAELAARR